MVDRNSQLAVRPFFCKYDSAKELPPHIPRFARSASACAAAYAPLVTRLISLATAPTHLAAAAPELPILQCRCRHGYALRPD
jgi:hypothetical protein